MRIENGVSILRTRFVGFGGKRSIPEALRWNKMTSPTGCATAESLTELPSLPCRQSSIVATHACALWQDNCACAKSDAERMDAGDEEMKRSASPRVGESETQINLVPSGGKHENNAKEEAAESPRRSELEKTALPEKMLADETVITGSSPSPPPQTKFQEGGKKESAGHDSSKQLAGSSKLEDQINLQHLVELMQIFYVS